MAAATAVRPLTVDIHAEEEQKYAAIKAVCKQLLQGWSDCSDQDITITCVSGGISNALYKVTPSSSSSALSPVIFRIYGDNTERFVDRHKELHIMEALHQRGFGPALLAAFDNGRIESYLTARCLDPEEMCKAALAQRIATTLARFHTTPMPHSDKDSQKESIDTPFNRIREWLAIARSLDFSSSPEKKAIFDTFDFDALVAEVDTLEFVALKFKPTPPVFAHNDLLAGNIMMFTTDSVVDGDSKKEGDMTFIDFEYAALAPRGFDWGNHFCEYAGFDCDYSRYPNADSAGIFLKAYLTEAAALAGTPNYQPLQEEITTAVKEANVYALAAHQFWGAWAFMQAAWSSIDFDYMSYAKLRWDEYFKRKEEFLNV